MANEKRLIDANYLIRDINADIYRTESEKSYDRCLVHRQPTVDAVEVVRCRDCKLYNRHRYCNYLAEAVLDDDFCSYGERRTDGKG